MRQGDESMSSCFGTFRQCFGERRTGAVKLEMSSAASEIGGCKEHTIVIQSFGCDDLTTRIVAVFTTYLYYVPNRQQSYDMCCNRVVRQHARQT